ncbi:hypothetical protein PJI74_01330 [Mycobacterium kansasii]
MTDTITVKEAAAVRRQIADYRKQQGDITTSGEQHAAVFDQLTTAFGVSVTGTAPTDVPESHGPAARAQATATAAKLGEAADELERWLDGLTVVDDDTKTVVQKQGT